MEHRLLMSRNLIYVHGDKSGKLLATQLRGFKAKQFITEIKTENGNTTLDPSEVNKTFKDFYSR